MAVAWREKKGVYKQLFAALEQVTNNCWWERGHKSKSSMWGINITKGEFLHNKPTTQIKAISQSIHQCILCFDIDLTYIRPLVNVFGTLAYQPNGLHARIGECRVTGELRQAFHGILERVNQGREVLIVNFGCKVNKTEVTPLDKRWGWMSC